METFKQRLVEELNDLAFRVADFLVQKSVPGMGSITTNSASVTLVVDVQSVDDFVGKY